MAINGIAKVQHYVPRFLLKNFVTGKKEQVWVFDKATGKRFRTNVRNVAAETGFYDFELKDAKLTLEPALSDLEGKTATILKPIIRQASLESLTQEDRHTLSYFLAVQFVRTKQWREMWAAFSEDFAESLRKRGINPDQIEGYKAPSEKDLKLEAVSAIVTRAKEFAPHFLSKTWVLLKATRNHPFYIGDNPVAMYNNISHGPYGNIGLAVRGIEIYLPLSSHLTLAMWCPSHVEELRKTVKNIALIRSVDAATADRFSAGPLNAEDLLRCIETGRASGSLRDNIIYTNSLQARSASRFVFSPSDNFELVERMIFDDPAIRRGPRITTS
jgi:hypothetical protein